MARRQGRGHAAGETERGKEKKKSVRWQVTVRFISDC